MTMGICGDKSVCMCMSLRIFNCVIMSIIQCKEINHSFIFVFFFEFLKPITELLLFTFFGGYVHLHTFFSFHVKCNVN